VAYLVVVRLFHHVLVAVARNWTEPQ